MKRGIKEASWMRELQRVDGTSPSKLSTRSGTRVATKVGIRDMCVWGRWFLWGGGSSRRSNGKGGRRRRADFMLSWWITKLSEPIPIRRIFCTLFGGCNIRRREHLLSRERLRGDIEFKTFEDLKSKGKRERRKREGRRGRYDEKERTAGTKGGLWRNFFQSTRSRKNGCCEMFASVPRRFFTFSQSLGIMGQHGSK